MMGKNIYILYIYFSGQANQVAKEAANRWTGMYYNGNIYQCVTTGKLDKLLCTF